MYRFPTFSIQNCLILQNRYPLTFVPKQFTTYFINSKRRFFLYFKYKDDMQQVIRIFEKQNVKFYQRRSIFPDREQYEEIVFHCNYKYKKKDLRWSLKHETKLREPRVRFDQQRNQLLKQTFKDQKFQPIQTEDNQLLKLKQNQQGQKLQITEIKQVQQMQLEQTAPQYVADFGQVKIKNPQVLDIINNIQLIKALFKAEKKK